MNTIPNFLKINSPSIVLNPNERIDPLFEKTKIHRVVDAALPLLCLHSPFATATHLLLGGVEGAKQTKLIFHAIVRSEWQTALKGSYQLTLIIASIALSILLPPLHTVFSHSYFLCIKIAHLFSHLKQHEWTMALKDCQEILTTALYLSCVLTGEIELICLSLIVQACYELQQGIVELKKGHFIEAIAKFALAAIRGTHARPHFSTMKRNLFGKSLTQKELNEFINFEYDTSSLEEVLIKKNISSIIFSLEFQGDLTLRSFTNLKLIRCAFNSHVATQEAFFQNIKFIGCRFDRSTFIKSLFHNCHFSLSSFHDSAFYASTLKEVNFLGSDLTRCCFNDSLLSRVKYVACELLEANFFATQVKNSTIFFSNLTDCLLAGAKEQFTLVGSPHQITRPIIGLSWNFSRNGLYATYIDRALKEENAIVFKYDYLPDDIDPQKLSQEVHELIQEVRKHPSKNMLSIADEILKRSTEKHSEIKKALNRMHEVCKYIHALAIPGGEDVEEVFYNEDAPLEDVDFRRSITDFSVIQSAIEEEIPTLGVCRGAQVINVGMGGKIKNVDPDSHLGQIHTLQLKKDLPDEYKKFMNDHFMHNENLSGLSLHHQAIDKVGKGLIVAIEHEGAPELTISENRQFILTQFHPEDGVVTKEQILKVIATLEKEKNKPGYTTEEKQQIIDYLKQVLHEAKKNQSFFTYLVERAQEKRTQEARF